MDDQRRTFEIEVCEKPLEHVTCVCACVLFKSGRHARHVSNDSFPRMRVTDGLQVVADTRERCVSCHADVLSASAFFSPLTRKARQRVCRSC